MAILSERQVYRAASAVTAAAAGLAVRKILHVGWRALKGKDPPQNPESQDVSWGDALLFAAASGMLVAVGRLAARRATAGALRSAPPDSEAD